ncbi:hypothetical protein JKF63_04422 [Porcisia hertigi]|uniref:UDP-galactose transporter n=1 Tax=Porcisia hertigi TaxID=2761500 RepID=A0A836IIB1_9TRYP|nr:hypothetical protein JKF63_04422 [Porcisia hertigi]
MSPEVCGADGCGAQSLPTPPLSSMKPCVKQRTPPRSGSAAAAFSASSKVLLLLQMLLCVAGINLCFGWWSVKQERAITKPYFIAESTFTASVTALAAENHDARRAAAVAAAKRLAPPGKPHPVYLSTVYGISLTQTLAGAVVSATLLGLNGLLRRFLQRSQSLPRRQDHAKGRAKSAVDKRQSPPFCRQDFLKMLVMGFSNIFGTSLGYAAMRRLSYPVTLTAKMGKMLPVMLVGFLWHRTRYSPKKIVSCLLITGGIIGFFLLENRINTTANSSSTTTDSSGRNTGSSAKGRASSSSSSLFGMTLLVLSLLMDGYTNSTQDVLVKRHQWSGVSLMMRTNLVSVMCALWLLFLLEFGEKPWQWLGSFLQHSAVSAVRSPLVSNSALGRPLGAWLEGTGAVLTTSAVPFNDLSHFVAFLVDCPEARHDVFLMSLLSALGQLFVFHTITVFGTLALTAMTLLRKSGSVILSIVVNGHPVERAQWASLGAVFVGVIAEGYINIEEASLSQQRRAQKGNGASRRRQQHSVNAPFSAKAVPLKDTSAPEVANIISKTTNGSRDAADAAEPAHAERQVLHKMASSIPESKKMQQTQPRRRVKAEQIKGSQ